MPKWPLLFIAILTTLPVFSQPQPTLYSAEAGSVVYLQHELYLKASDSSDPEAWHRLEKIIKTSILDTAFPLASGSGFFLDTEGTILTNRHVVKFEDIEGIRADFLDSMSQALDGSLGSSLSAQARSAMKDDFEKMIGKAPYTLAVWSANKRLGDAKVICVADDKEADLAVLRIEGSGYRGLRLAEASAMGPGLVGSDVFSLGYPLGANLDDFLKDRAVTMNKGIVSAFRTAELSLQHSAAISHGNSGGPLVDAAGRVVGVNTAGLTEVQGNSLFYAIDAGRVRAFLEKRGLSNLLKWNARLEDPMAGAAVKLNVLGEFETSASLIVDVAKDVEIWLDGSLAATGPSFLTISQPQSSLELRSGSGVFAAKLRLLSNLQGSTTLRPSLSQAAQKVSIETVPAGAVVFADGRKLGVSPLLAELGPDSYAIRCELDKAWFDEATIQVSAGSANAHTFVGEPTFPVTITGARLEQSASLEFISSRGSKSFKSGEAIRLAQGTWTLNIVGSPAFPGVTIPAKLDGEGLTLDLAPFVRSSSLKIVGLIPTSKLWVDGQPFSLAGLTNDAIALPLGIHTVFGLNPGWQPLEPIKITVRDDGQSFVTWDRIMGYDRSSKTLMWSGVGLGGLGAVLIGLGAYFGQDSVAIAATSSYADYFSFKERAQTAILAGGLGLMAGAVCEYLSGREAALYKAQQERIKNLEAGK